MIRLKTPTEICTKKPNNYFYLHAFGCYVYVMYNAWERTNLDPKSRGCIFLRYIDSVKEYCLWDPTTYKIVNSRDIIFIKDQLQKKNGDDSTVKKGERLYL